MTSEALLAPSEMLQLLKDKIEKRTSYILASCEMCKNRTTLHKVYDCLGSALGELYDENSIKTRKRTTSNQKQTPQPRFHSTHKKRKIESKCLSKPSNEETVLSQEVLHQTDTSLCAICFKEEDTTLTLRLTGCCVVSVGCGCTKNIQEFLVFYHLISSLYVNTVV